MKIIVCIKQICLTYARTGMDPERYFLAPEDEVYRVNPYDEMALEMALRLRDNHKNGEIIILTLGPIIAEAELRRCLAMGAQDICQIDAKGEMDPWRKSGLLSRAIEDMGPNLILCGKESLDTRNGQIGAFISHRLGMPYVSAITDLTLKNRGTVKIQKSAGRGVREVMECRLPAVFSVDLASHEPRLPTYEDRQQAQSIPIRKLTYPDGTLANKTISMGTFPPLPRPKKVPAPDSSLEAFYRIQHLLMGSRIEKKGTILRGSPQSQAEGIISFLSEHGFLQSKRVRKRKYRNTN